MPLTAPDAVFCRDEAEVYASFSHQQGLTHQVVHSRASRRGLSHPARERLPQPVVRMDGAVPWGSNLLAGELSGLVQDAGALRAGNRCLSSTDTISTTSHHQQSVTKKL